MTVTDVREDLKARLQSTIERDAPALTRFAEDIADHPELGFREERTASKVAEGLRALGLTVEKGIGVTGLRARLKIASEGATIAVRAELDALPVPDHPRIIRAFKPELMPDQYLAKMRAFTTMERFVYD